MLKRTIFAVVSIASSLVSVTSYGYYKECFSVNLVGKVVDSESGSECIQTAPGISSTDSCVRAAYKKDFSCRVENATMSRGFIKNNCELILKLDLEDCNKN